MIVFSQAVIQWQKEFGRHHLPWQQTRDPYKVWLSEIMLQQTQVTTVIPYFVRFLNRFPTITSLAEAHQDQVLELWAGLGYYSRARNLHHAAQQITSRYNSTFPIEQELREQLPGIGKSTAGAIGVFAFNQRLPILDGNVKRVLTRYFAIEGNIYSKEIERKLWELAESLLPDDNIVAYTQGLMDLGATICTRTAPLCRVCPLVSECRAKHSNTIDRYPERKKKVVVQVVKLTVLIIEHEKHYYLIKRNKNIWKNLWAFPMVEEPVDTQQWLTQQHIQAQLKTTYPKLKHQLTHRTLELSVEHWQVEQQFSNQLTSEGLWLTVDQIQQKAIPVAMNKILTYLL
ncbi:A/G-specific adenine glycosylase [Ferrovum sp. PN-J185]|uniref:A/G-specific adenine glycosylase n=1 Tax=Ferrovum sp. PN-J185 TaxID=1356306 RepID=UPI000796809B|nr:A/G-specific adenine glycosylase [Ferrovum sp. PN-J185]KXW56016.1 A/G-specific adenine glycosylase [Ferrovum sp. PN-J185]MCC6068272.1 A/G-specific adenine glycosylase [Ferrovum sp. PN-J185]MDE1892293.1 A/G-specific adenine glycosylase [Betaproteobacteria bacterium]MDE2056661.1 A/G-specific adenine glycosylase [Betaproteobacteria bacterium]